MLLRSMCLFKCVKHFRSAFKGARSRARDKFCCYWCDKSDDNATRCHRWRRNEKSNRFAEARLDDIFFWCRVKMGMVGKRAWEDMNFSDMREITFWRVRIRVASGWEQESWKKLFYDKSWMFIHGMEREIERDGWESLERGGMSSWECEMLKFMSSTRLVPLMMRFFLMTFQYW